MSTFSYGPNSMSTPNYDGQPVSAAKAGLKAAFNLPDSGLRVVINGEVAEDGDLIEAGDSVVFSKAAGEKG